MIMMRFQIWIQVLFALLVFSSKIQAQALQDDTRGMVAMRMIGHQIMLSMGDSSSRILPIEKEKNGYRIRFENDFEFDPENLVTIINEVVEQADFATSYFVVVENCKAKEQVYSYAMGINEEVDLVPCQGRLQPSGCYEIVFTMATENDIQSLIAANDNYPVDELESQAPQHTKVPFSIYMFLAILMLFVLFLVVKKMNGNNKYTIKIGEYKFDTKNLLLFINGEKTELTSKESDLLLLLHNSVNNTVERNVILNAVWGDEGDYIGRTLDVFISKLRKKLEADSAIKIVNVRGVGYRLIVNA